MFECFNVYFKGQCENQKQSLSTVKGYGNEVNLNSKERYNKG